MSPQIHTNLVIIGAGPVGLFAAFQAGMLKLDCIIVDALNEVGGQCAMLYPDKPIYDIPAYPMISGFDLIQRLKEQIEPFQQQIFLQSHIKRIKKIENELLLELHTKDGITHIRTKSVIIATGGGTFTPNKPPIENIETFEGKSIFYSVTDRKKFRNKKIAIAGGGDSAVDWAINLSDIAEKIYLIHRRNKFRASPANLDILNMLVQENKVEIIVPYQLAHLEGKNGILQKVYLKDMDGNLKVIEVDILLPFFGLAMKHDELLTWGVEMTKDNRHIVVDVSTMSTNIEGVFAIGDIAEYPGKLKLILTGFAEAALACHSSYKIINPDKELHFEHSTTKGLPT